jgi:hypothetical protein
MSDDPEEPYIVPDRECGSCTACCNDLAIVEPEMAKLPGVPCKHCIPGAGCAIYETRLRVCREYHCGWRSRPYMDESWRPDRSGVLITLEFSVDAPVEANLILVGGEQVSRSDHFAGVAAGFIESGTITWLVLPSELGMQAYSVRLNELLGPAIRARDLAEAKALLAECCLTMKEQPLVPISAELMNPRGKR